MSDEVTLDPIAQLVEEFTARCRGGDRPSVTEYVDRHPQYAERLRQVLPMIAMLNAAAPSVAAAPPDESPGPMAEPPARLGGYRIVREIGRGGMGIVFEAEQIALGRRVALKVLPLPAARAGGVERFRREAMAAARLHHPNIVPVYEVGEEGDQCYYAMQFIHGQPLDQVLDDMRHLQPQGSKAPTDNLPAATRLSAVQSLLASTTTLPPRRPGETESLKLADAETIATSPATSDSSEVSGTAAVVRQYYQCVANIGIQAAEALEYAHREGVVHRDVKPANLLLDSDGRVWITDFGLAKTEGASLTGSRDLIGTLRYMAPERFRGWSDPRSDVYSLGLTLHEMLLLRPSFDAEDQAELLQQILWTSPQPLRKKDPRIPRDLETIVNKAIDKEPGRRYQTAAELAEDLKRYLSHLPIQARRTGWLERAGRLCRRNPAVATLAACVLLVTLVGMAGVIWQWQAAMASERESRRRANLLFVKTGQAERSAREAAAQEQQAKKDRDEAREANDRLLRANYVNVIALAKQAWDSGGVMRARQLLDQLLPDAGSMDLRGFEWFYLDRLCRQRLIHSLDLSSPVLEVAVSPDGRQIAVGMQDGRVAALDATGADTVLWDVNVLNSRVRGLAYSADGSHIAAVGFRRITMLNAETGDIEFHETSGTPISSVAYHPGGKLLALGMQNGTVRFRPVADGVDTPPALTGHTTAVRALAFSPDGRLMASGSADSPVMVRHTQTWEPLEYSPLESHRDGVLCLAFDAAGRYLAAGGVNRMTKVWDTETGTLRLKRPVFSNGGVHAVSFSPDGEVLAIGGGQQVIDLIAAATGERLQAPAPWRGHTSVIHALQFFGQRRIVSGGTDDAVRIWSTDEIDESTTLATVRSRRAMAVSGDGHVLARTGSNATVDLLSAETGDVIRTWESPKTQLMCGAFSADNRLVAAGFAGGDVVIWDVRGDSEPVVLPSQPDSQLLSLAFSPDGKQLATGARTRPNTGSGALRLWDVRTGELVRVMGASSPAVVRAVHGVAFHPDGTRLVSGSSDGLARLWDVATGEEIQELREEHLDYVRAVRFSPDGRFVVSASGDGLVKIRDAHTGTLVHTLAGHAGPIFDVSYSRDGTRLASASGDRLIKIWDAGTGQELLSLGGHDDAVNCVAFDADAVRVFSLSLDGSLRAWDARPLPDAGR